MEKKNNVYIFAMQTAAGSTSLQWAISECEGIGDAPFSPCNNFDNFENNYQQTTWNPQLELMFGVNDFLSCLHSKPNKNFSNLTLQ